MGNPLYDIAIYTLEREGCLRGVFTNPGIHNRPCYEIAIRKDKSKGIEGTYNCSYKSDNNKTYTGELTITRLDDRYAFVWHITTEDGAPINRYYGGAGYERSSGRIAVYYRERSALSPDPAFNPSTVRLLSSNYMELGTV